MRQEVLEEKKRPSLELVVNGRTRAERMMTGFLVKKQLCWVLHLLSTQEPEHSLMSSETAAPLLAEMFVASHTF